MWAYYGGDCELTLPTGAKVFPTTDQVREGAVIYYTIYMWMMSVLQCILHYYYYYNNNNYCMYV